MVLSAQISLQYFKPKNPPSLHYSIGVEKGNILFILNVSLYDLQ